MRSTRTGPAPLMFKPTMNRALTYLVPTAAALTVFGFAVALRREWFPLGVPGEWTWGRLPAEVLASILSDKVATSILRWALGCSTCLAFAGFAALGRRALANGPSRVREATWVAGMAFAAAVAQIGIQYAAPEGYGLEKWTVALYYHGSNGYYSAARDLMAEPREFWRAFPSWIKDQDSLHIGTHPPGLFLLWRATRGLVRGRPEVARAVVDYSPPAVRAGFRMIDVHLRNPEAGSLPTADRAVLTLVGLGTLVACALTVLPLYLLARSSLPAASAWTAAALWPLAPAAILCQPTADAAYPLLSTLALALASRRGWPSKIAAGIALAVGAQFSLVFFPVGLIVGAIAVLGQGRSTSQRVAAFSLIGLGFLATTLGLWAFSGANPFVIWWWNARNHSRFYDLYPRSWLAWNVANPVEVAIAIGLPAAIAALVGLPRAGRACGATLVVLLLLQVSGRNLGEVARLWLPFFPALLIASAAGVERLRLGPWGFAALVVLGGLQTLLLQDAIQVVYPRLIRVCLSLLARKAQKRAEVVRAETRRRQGGRHE